MHHFSRPFDAKSDKFVVPKCISVISEILEAIGIWVPGAEKFFNGFNIYSG
jgi:hypothetical protein